MPRLSDSERQKVIGGFSGHYQELLAQHPDWKFAEDFGWTQLHGLFESYKTQQETISTLENTTLPNKRAERDSLFGTSCDEINGAWFVLTLYRKMVRSRLPKNHALFSTAPLMSRTVPGNYDAILGRFIEHWKLVNEALPDDKPLLIAGKSLGDMEAARVKIANLAEEIDEITGTRLPFLRAEREQLFGDVAEEERDATSIVARLESYSVEVQSQFAGTIWPQTLPRIFPILANKVRFDFNFRVADNQMTLWWKMKEDLRARAAAIYIKQGLYEAAQPIPAAPYQVIFSDIESADEPDFVELRDRDDKAIARGRFNADLSEPV